MKILPVRMPRAIRFMGLQVLWMALVMLPAHADPKPAEVTVLKDSGQRVQIEVPSDFVFETTPAAELPEGRSVSTGKAADKSGMMLATYDRKTTDATALEIMDMVTEKFAKGAKPPTSGMVGGLPSLFRKFRMPTPATVVTFHITVVSSPDRYFILMGTCHQENVERRVPQFDQAAQSIKPLAGTGGQGPPPAVKPESAPDPVK